MITRERILDIVQREMNQIPSISSKLRVQMANKIAYRIMAEMEEMGEDEIYLCSDCKFDDVKDGVAQNPECYTCKSSTREKGNWQKKDDKKPVPTFSSNEMNLMREWFYAIRDLTPYMLDERDYVLAERLCVMLNVPPPEMPNKKSIKDKPVCPKCGGKGIIDIPILKGDKPYPDKHDCIPVVCQKCGGVGFYETGVGEYDNCDCQQKQAEKPKWVDMSFLDTNSEVPAWKMTHKVNELVVRVNEIAKEVSK